MLMLMISLPFAAEVDYILKLWLKTPPEHTSLLVNLVLINVNIASFTYFLYQSIHATGKITFQQLCTSIIFGLNVLGIYVAFKIGAGFQYALVITIFASILQVILNVYCAKRFLEFNISFFLLKVMLPSVFVTFISLLVVWFVKSLLPSSFLRLIITLVVSTITILLCSLLLLYNKAERKTIYSYVEVFLNKFRRINK